MVKLVVFRNIVSAVLVMFIGKENIDGPAHDIFFRKKIRSFDGEIFTCLVFQHGSLGAK